MPKTLKLAGLTLIAASAIGLAVCLGGVGYNLMQVFDCYQRKAVIEKENRTINPDANKKRYNHNIVALNDLTTDSNWHCVYSAAFTIGAFVSYRFLRKGLSTPPINPTNPAPRTPPTKSRSYPGNKDIDSFLDNL